MGIPDRVVQRILTHADIGIDMRREFGVPPRKLKGSHMIPRRRPIVYICDTQTMFVFHDNVIEIHRPIPLSYMGRTYALFNETNGPYFGLTILMQCITFKGCVLPRRSGWTL